MNSFTETQKKEVVVDEQGVRMQGPSRIETSELADLQLALVSSSMNHEYTRQELEKTHSFDKKELLLARMSQWKDLYFSARNKLAVTHPERLEAIEQELHLEKQIVLSDVVLH